MNFDNLGRVSYAYKLPIGKIVISAVMSGAIGSLVLLGINRDKL